MHHLPSGLCRTRPDIFLEVLGKIIEIVGHHFAELVGEIFQRPLLFDFHVLRAARCARDDEGIEARCRVHGRGADYAWVGRIALVVRQVDECVDAIPEFRIRGVVTHDDG